MTQSSLSARLTGAAVSPGAGGGTDSLLKKPENVRRKKLQQEICMLFEIWAGSWRQAVSSVQDTDSFRGSEEKRSKNKTGVNEENKNGRVYL